jgi:hypothetical protein
LNFSESDAEAIDGDKINRQWADEDVAKNIRNQAEELVQENGIGSNINTIFYKLRGEKHQELGEFKIQFEIKIKL